MPEKAKVPAIRFKGFTDAWEQRKLTDEVELYSGLTYSPNDVIKDSGTLVLRSSNVKNGEVVDADNVYVQPDVVNSANVKVGDIIIVVRNGSRALIGKHAQIKAKMDNTVIGAFMTGMRSSNSAFTNVLLSTPAFDSEVEKNLGATINQITNGMFQNMQFMFPSTAEQMKIGHYFTHIDKLITLHQHKLFKLKNVKKAMLEKIFPKNGSNVPDIRFAGFTDAWEQREFSDITYLAGEKNRDNIPYQSFSISNEKGFIPQEEQFENGGTMKEANKSMYLIVQPNSFAYNPARINVGSIGYYDAPNNVIVSSLYEVFKTTDDIDDRFLWHWFKSDLFPKFIERYQEGGVRMYFYYNKLCMCSLGLPKIDEQRKIGAYFDKIDNLITLHQRKYEKLQNLKKACLEKMFV